MESATRKVDDAATSRSTGLGAVAAALGVALSWFCCLPFAAALGAGIAAAGASLTPFQPVMALASVTLLGVAFVQTWKGTRGAAGESCPASSRRRRWLFLAGVTAATLLLLTLPYWSSRLIYYWSL